MDSNDRTKEMKVMANGSLRCFSDQMDWFINQNVKYFFLGFFSDNEENNVQETLLDINFLK